MFSIVGPGSSSLMKNDDHPPGVLNLKGGDIYKTHVTDFCYQDSDKEGWYL